MRTYFTGYLGVAILSFSMDSHSAFFFQESGFNFYCDSLTSIINRYAQWESYRAL